MPRRDAIASHSARRAAYAVPASVRGTPEWTTSTATPGAMGTGVVALLRQSTSSAWPARPNNDASWSIRPPGTPVAATSAARARRAVSSGSSATPAASHNARVDATESAVLEESPEPSGTVDVTRSPAPGTARPRSASTRTAPATKRPQTGSTCRGSALPSAGTSTVPASCAELAVTIDPSAGVAITVHARSMARGNTNPPL